MRFALPTLALAACWLGSIAIAAENVAEPARTQNSQTPAAAAVQMFSKPVSLRGVLGDAQVQLNLRPKVPAEEGIEGDYFVFGKSPRIFLAGEVEGNDVLMEESENGTDVSGQWTGTFNGDTFSGDWQSADGTVTKHFALKAVRATATQNMVKQETRAAKPVVRTQPKTSGETKNE